MEQLEGRVAVVTGAASGIGLALAERFAAAGMRVVLGDVEEDALAAAVAGLEAAGAEVLGIRTDVSDPAAVQALADCTFERFGTAHVVCNNAGVAGAFRAWDGPLAPWEWIVGVNLWGVVHGIRAFLPRLLEQGEGHIVNTASAAGIRPTPFMAPYVASKHAVVGLSESLLHELTLLGSPVKVSVLCPTWVRTQIVEADRNWPAVLGAEPDRDDAGVAMLLDVARGRAEAGLDPAAVAVATVEAVRAGRFWILPDPSVARIAAARFAEAAEGRDPPLPAL